MKLMGGKSEEDEKLIDHAIEVTGLEEFRNRELSQLSGGQWRISEQ
jgi:iron complex transport system ATP-binding protein